MEILDRLRGVLGVAVLLAIAWALSTNRRKIPWRVLLWGLGLQVGFALLILKTWVGETGFDYARRAAARSRSQEDQPGAPQKSSRRCSALNALPAPSLSGARYEAFRCVRQPARATETMPPWRR